MREIQAVLKELHRLAQHNNQNLLKCKTSSLSTFVLIILHSLFCTSAISPTRNLTMIESYCYWRDFLVVHMLQKTLLIAVRSFKNIKKGGCDVLLNDTQSFWTGLYCLSSTGWQAAGACPGVIGPRQDTLRTGCQPSHHSSAVVHNCAANCNKSPF